MRREGLLINIGAHFFKRLADARNLFYIKRVAGNQSAVLSPLIAAHSGFKISGRRSAPGKFLKDKRAYIGFTCICTRPCYKQFLCHGCNYLAYNIYLIPRRFFIMAEFFRRPAQLTS